MLLKRLQLPATRHKFKLLRKTASHLQEPEMMTLPTQRSSKRRRFPTWMRQRWGRKREQKKQVSKLQNEGVFVRKRPKPRKS